MPPFLCHASPWVLGVIVWLILALGFVFGFLVCGRLTDDARGIQNDWSTRWRR